VNYLVLVVPLAAPLNPWFPCNWNISANVPYSIFRTANSLLNFSKDIMDTIPGFSEASSIMSAGKDFMNMINPDDPKTATPAVQGVPTATVSQGIAFSDQTPKIGTSGNMEATDTVKSEPHIIGEPAWSMQNQLSKPIQLSTFTYSTTQPVGTLVHSLTLPLAFVSANSITNDRSSAIATFLKTYAYARFNIRLRIQASTTLRDSGRLKFVWFPQSMLQTFERSVSMGGTEWSAQENSVIDMVIPWTYPQSHFLNHAQNQFPIAMKSLGKLCVYSLAPLFPGNDDTSRTFIVFGSLEAIHPSFIAPTTDVVIAATPFYHEQMDHDYQYMVDTPFVDSRTLSMPVLNTNPGTTSSLGRLNGSSEKEFDLYEMCKIPGLIFSQAIPNLPQGSVITALAVHPFVYALSADGPAAQVLTRLAYVTNCASYWRGGLKFMIQITKDKFTRGRLGLAYVPKSYGLGPANQAFAVQANFETHYIDLADQSELTFEIPFSDVKQISLVGSRQVFVPNGTVVVFIANPIVLSEAGIEPYINIFISAGNDYQLYFPRRPEFENLLPPALFKEYKKKKEAKYSEQMDNGYSETTNFSRLPDSIIFGGMAHAKPADLTIPLNPIKDVHDLLSRPLPYANYSATEPLRLQLSPGAGINNTYSFYFSKLYNFWMGTFKFHVYSTSSADYKSITYIPDRYYSSITDTNNIIGYPQIIFRSDHTPFINVKIPAILPYDACTTETAHIPESSTEIAGNFIQSAGTVLLRSSGDVAPDDFVIYESVDSDFKFSNFVGVPSISQITDYLNGGVEIRNLDDYSHRLDKLRLG